MPEPKMKHRTHKLSQEEQEQTATRGESLQHSKPLEFASPEEVLRYDAAHTEVPANVAQRLQKSLADQPPLSQPWWRRFFGRTR